MPGQRGQLVNDDIRPGSVYCRLDRGGIEHVGGDRLRTQLGHNMRRFRRTGQRENGVTILFKHRISGRPMAPVAPAIRILMPFPRKEEVKPSIWGNILPIKGKRAGKPG